MEAKFTFHPVGQGLFYSGQIKNAKNEFNFVYDCGSTNVKNIRNCTELYKEFNFEKTIDLLILSHLHADHINGIEFLIDNGFIIKKVIMPYVSTIQRLYLALSETTQKQWYYDFLANSKKIFKDANELIELMENSDTNNIKKEKYEEWNWEFVFYNKVIDDFYFSGFRNKLESINYGKQLPDEELLEIITEKNKRDKFKSAYYYLKPELDNNINNSSIVLFHSPSLKNANKAPDSKNFAGHLLTGDISFRDCYLDNISNYFKDYLNSIMIFQLPHHGSIKNWDHRILEVFNQTCIYFYCGRHKGWQHPNPNVVKKIEDTPNKCLCDANEIDIEYGYKDFDYEYINFIRRKKLERILYEETEYNIKDLFKEMVTKQSGKI